jgi:hypothetical protein
MKPIVIDEIIDSVLDQLAAGKSPAAILAEYPEHAAELSGILAVIQPAMTLPKNGIPAPVRRRRYVAALHVPWQERLQRVFRIALIPATAVFILVGVSQFAIAAEHSLPGTTLYRFKLAAERTRVAVTTDQNEKAHLELAYSQKRLTDVQAVLQQENSSPDQKVAALTELKNQTQKTFALVPTVATSNALNNNDDTLFKGLIAVNNQQKDLLKTLPAQDETNEIATTALQVTEDHQKTIATLLAAVNDKTLIDLVDQQISITGTVQLVNIAKQTITVEKNSFVVNDSTQIKFQDKDLTLAGLPAKTQVTIVGSKTANGMVADRIDVLVLADAPDKSGEVKGATTGTVKPTGASDGTTQPIEPKPSTPAPAPDPNTVTGGYIIEQPDQ